MTDSIRIETSMDTRTHAAVSRGPGAYFVRVPQLLEHRRFMLAALILSLSHLLRNCMKRIFQRVALTYALCVTMWRASDITECARGRLNAQLTGKLMISSFYL